MGGEGCTARSSKAAALWPWFCLRVLGLGVLMSEPACAGAWTQPVGRGLTITTASYHDFAMREPGSGFSKIETALYAEYGLTDRLTLVGRLAYETRYQRTVRRVSKAGAIYTQPFNTVSQGWGEREAGLRFRTLQHNGWTFSSQISALLLPDEPQNGFGAAAGWGAEARLLLGRSVGERMFVDAQLAHRTRLNGGMGEQRMDLTVGVRPTGRWLVLAQTSSAWGARGGVQSFESHRFHVSVTAPVADRLSVQIGAFNSFSNDGLSPESAYMLALWREF